MKALRTASRAAMTALLLVSHLPLAAVLPGPAGAITGSASNVSGCSCGPDCACTGGCCDHSGQRHSQHRQSRPDTTGRLQARTTLLTNDGCGCGNPALLLLPTFRHDLAIIAGDLATGFYAPLVRQGGQSPAVSAAKETHGGSGPRGPPSSP